MRRGGGRDGRTWRYGVRFGGEHVTPTVFRLLRAFDLAGGAFTFEGCVGALPTATDRLTSASQDTSDAFAHESVHTPLGESYPGPGAIPVPTSRLMCSAPPERRVVGETAKKYAVHIIAGG